MDVINEYKAKIIFEFDEALISTLKQEIKWHFEDRYEWFTIEKVRILRVCFYECTGTIDFFVECFVTTPNWCDYFHANIEKDKDGDYILICIREVG